MNTVPIKVFLLFLCACALPCNGAEKSRLVTQLEAGNKQVVVAYGTSLTSDGAWVAQMAEVLNQRFPGLVTVINSGGSGRWSGWGVTNLEERVLRQHPDTVFIEFAINDCAEHFKGTVEIARNNLESMIDSIRKTNPQCEIILMTMTPGNGFPEGHRSYRKGIEGYYDMYRSVAKARKLMLIDHYPNWKALESRDRALFQKYVPDTIHPTAEGCSKMVTPVILAALGIKDADAAKSQLNPPSAMRLHLPGPIESSLDAIPLGNGLCGGLLWGKGTNVHLSLDRGDLWDLRPHPGYTNAGFTYQTVVEMAQAGRTAELNRQFAKVSLFPTKVPGARLVVELPAGVSVDGFSLDLRGALGKAELKGASAIEGFFSATAPVAMLKIPGARPGFKLVGNPCFEKELGFAAAEVENTADSSSLLQEVGGDFRFAIHVQAERAEGATVLAVSIVTSRDDKNPLALARKRTAAALAQGYEPLRQEHEAWWARFWAKSSVQIPDPAIQLHYNLVQYYYGAASRSGEPPIPLQGVWTTDNGKLPAWRGDYHNDLNTQLTYWAYLTSGRFDQGVSFTEFMWSLKPQHEEFARKFFGVPAGHIVPGVMALDGRPMGSWLQYTLSTTMGAWVAQSFHQHWRYTADKNYLSERAYPYCAGIGEALLALLKPDAKTGRLKLPLSTSPEIHNNTQAAWLTPNSNNDLALLRWLFAANEEMATALGRHDDATKWKTARLNLDELAVEGDAGALRLSPDESLTKAHRHFAHLMAIHPLGNLNLDGTDRDRAIINASLTQLESLGFGDYCGYSHAWRSCLMARAGRPEQALESLRRYMPITRRNGFHCNYLSNPVITLEGNFAAGQALHEMLLQSWGGKLRIFPAVPAPWNDVAFERLRAEGGFIVSARRVAGKNVSVTITATLDQSLQLVNPFGDIAFRADHEVARVGSLIRCELKANQTLKLQLAAESAAMPQPDRQRVACLGDSITLGSGASPRAEEPYPAQLGMLLGDEFEVRNFGVGSATLLSGGDKPYRKQPQFQAALAYDPDLVILMLGVNDTCAAPRGNWAKSGAFVADARNLLCALQRPGRRVIAGLPTPMLPDTPGLKPERKVDLESRRPRLAQVREWWREAARAGRAEVVDLADVLEADTGLVTDGVHPTPAGYERIARRFCDAILGANTPPTAPPQSDKP